MKNKTYAKNINTKNTYNPYSNKIKMAALMTPIPTRLLTNSKYKGASATSTDYHTHHIYDRNLFPMKCGYSAGTAIITVSSDMHAHLHNLLASAKTHNDFIVYEQAIKAECAVISDNIADEYIQRIESLPTGFALILRRLLNWF